MCICSVDLIHESHSAPVLYPTMHYAEQKWHISDLNGALWNMGQVHCAICDVVVLNIQEYVTKNAWMYDINWHFISCVSVKAGD